MSKQILISPSQAVSQHWRSAFPNGQIVARLQQAKLAGNGHSPTLWLDVSRIDVSLRGSWLQQAVNTGCSVIVMNNQPGEAEAFDMVRQGAMGYCHAQAASRQLKEIAAAVENGGLWLGPDLLQRLLSVGIRHGAKRTAAPVPAALDSLTDREHAVGLEVSKGATNREIAETLSITERTVKAHLSAIFNKLKVRDRVQLALLLNEAH